jgi:murein DD-endopeptidase MepM/ murein hydrolase activator NlpD
MVAMSRDLLLVVALLVPSACSAPEDHRTVEQPASSPASSSSATSATRPSPTDEATEPAPAPTRTRRGTPPADPRWAFFTDDRRRLGSPWFAGRWRVMIPYGCTPAPYYSPDPSCPDGQGFHHGIDLAMPCGTPLRAGRPARVLDNGTLGPAYGDDPVLLRVDGLDVVVGHTRRVLAVPGERLGEGQRFGLAGDSGAPDGCHLHFEVRRAGGGVGDAVDPAGLLGLR